MNECNSYEKHNICPHLNDQQQFRLNKITEIKDCFIAEIKERELMSKKFSKYIDFSYYFHKLLIVLSVTTGCISIAPFATVIGALVRTRNASFSLAFLILTGIVKRLLKTT